jgi:hypothetical protein
MVEAAAPPLGKAGKLRVVGGHGRDATGRYAIGRGVIVGVVD